MAPQDITSPELIRKAKVRERNLRYRAANRERLIAYDRARKTGYYSKLSEEQRITRRASVARYKAGHLEQQRQYRATRKAQQRQADARWRAAHPDRVHDKNARRRTAIHQTPIVDRVSRAAIIARDRSICHICKKRVPPTQITLDHLIPLSRGGSHTADNLAVAHLSCNSRRGAGYLPAQLRLIG